MTTMSEQQNKENVVRSQKTATGTTTSRSLKGRRGVLRWGESEASFFMVDTTPEKDKRYELAARVQERPDDAGAWKALLDHASPSTSPSLLRLYRRATQCIPKDRPELKEAEAYVSIWVGFAQCQLDAGRQEDALEAFRYMKNEGIGKRNPGFYLAWARAEAASHRADAAREALQAGLRTVPAALRGDLTDLAATRTDDALIAALSEPNKEDEEPPQVAPAPEKTKSADDAWALKKQTFSAYTQQPPPQPPQQQHTATTTASSVSAATAFLGPMSEETTLGNTTTGKPPAKMMTRDDIDYMLRWEPGSARVSAAKGKPRVPAAAVPTPATKQVETKSSKSTATTSSSRRRSAGSSSSNVGDSSSSDDDTPSRKAKAQAKARLAEATRDLGVPTTAAKQQQVVSSRRPQAPTPQPDPPPESSLERLAFLDLVSEKNLVVVADRSYAKLALIGRGGSSKVFKVLDADGEILALKRIRLKGPEARENLVGYANEITLLRRLSGKPGIIALLAAEVDVDAGSINMIMEAGEADLATVLAQRASSFDDNGYPPLSHGNFLRLAWQQMLEAVKAIHEERIVHGDLKPANFLFVQGRLRLIDFGIARAIKNDTTNIYRDTQIGTLNYISPEAIRDTNIKQHGGGGLSGGPSSSSGNNPTDSPGVVPLRQTGLRGRGPPPMQRAMKPKMRVGRASDVWSLGCILYQMVYGRTPFGHLHLYAKLQAIANPFHEILLPEAPLASEDALDCLRGCLQREPSARPDITDGLLRHRFLEPPTEPPPEFSPENIETALNNVLRDDQRLLDPDHRRDLANAIHANLLAQRQESLGFDEDDVVDDLPRRPPLPQQRGPVVPPNAAEKTTKPMALPTKKMRRRSIVDRRDNRMRSLREEDDTDGDTTKGSLDGADILGLAVSSRGGFPT